MKDLMDNKSDKELIQSVLAEVAKAKNEVKCARADLDKANNRLTFLVVLANKLIERNEDKEK